ncbi:hypothetical protein [Breoghania sp.]|uniref:hypothetical protein n=1 Tax=Breoghania sp. TaxID=2065378 RepID=UPI00261FE86F|nr:hypothetical protein [Breoghania sp.]MDJ0933490.1 hypothetical protein [Breoghania sp.]
MGKQLDEKDLRPVLGALLGEFGGQILQIRPVRSAPDTDHPRLGERQLRKERVVAGTIDEDRVTRFDQMPDDQGPYRD